MVSIGRAHKREVLWFVDLNEKEKVSSKCFVLPPLFCDKGE